MRTLLLLLLGLLTFQKVSAQCSAVILDPVVTYQMDTTIYVYYADTTSASTGTTYAWEFSDTTFYSGSVVVKKFTHWVPSSSFWGTVTLRVSDGSGCADSTYRYVDNHFVFNCHDLTAEDHEWIGWGTMQANLLDATSTVVEINRDLDAYFALPDNFNFDFHLDWGNGVTFDTSVDSSGYYYAPLLIGGAGSPSSSRYQYGGQYLVRSTVRYRMGGMTCPVRNLDSFIYSVSGRIATPVISGATTYCVGDTLRLSASDTTRQFHNIWHTIDTTGMRGISYKPEDYYYGSLPPTERIYDITVLDRDGNIVNYPFDPIVSVLYDDSTVAFPLTEPSDSGVYYYRFQDRRSNADTIFPIHITLNGIKVLLDSFSLPGCIGSGGKIYLHTNPGVASYSVHYTRNGSDTSVNITSSASGQVVITGLTQAMYTNIRISPSAGGCGSNTILTRIDLNSNPAPSVSAEVVACAGSTVSLSATASGTGVVYHWSGPGGFSSTAATPSISGVSLSDTGNYNVYTAASGCLSANATIHVTVLTSVPPTPSRFLPDSICEGSRPYYHDYFRSTTVFPTVTSADSTIVAVLDPHQYSFSALSSGIVAITYTHTNVCGSSTTVRNVTVKSAYLPPITGPSNLCSGDTANFSDSVSGGTWSFRYYAVRHTGIRPTLSATGHFVDSGAGSVAIIYTKIFANRCSVEVQKPVTTGAPTLFENWPPILGIYPGDTVTLHYPYVFGATTIGSWSTSASTVASVTPAGFATANTEGSAVMTAPSSNSCGSSTASVYLYSSNLIAHKIAGLGAGFSYSNTDYVSAVSVNTDRAMGIALDTAGNRYIAYDAYIVKVDRSGIMTNYAGLIESSGPRSGHSVDGTALLSARLCTISNMVGDHAGNLYFIESADNLVRKISSSGVLSTVAGQYSRTNPLIPSIGGFSGDGGAAVSATLNNPGKLAVDNAGNVYIADNGNNRIRKVTPAGIISTIAGNGSSGFSGDGGPATNAALEEVGGIAIDGSGQVFISTSARIRKISTSGIITTVAGVTGGSSSDGIPATAHAADFNYAELAFDRVGNLIILARHSTMRKIDTTGIISTIALANDYGDFTVQRFDEQLAIARPSVYVKCGLAIDDSSNIYFGFGENNTVHRLGKPQIYVTAADTACSGTAVNCTAATFNVTSSVRYQWYRNGTASGTDANAYTYTPAIAGGGNDTVYCKVYDVLHHVLLAVSTPKVIRVLASSPALTVSGRDTVCQWDTAHLSSTLAGIWSSSDTTIARVGVTGIVTGISAGHASIRLHYASTCATADTAHSVTVMAGPSAGTISGLSTVCIGDTITLSTTAMGGRWYCSDTTIQLLSGVRISGRSAGTASVAYIVTNICRSDTARRAITVNSLPVAGTITGSSSVCVLTTATFTTTGTGGTWSTTNASVASVSGTGMVYPGTAGTATINYIITNSCGSDTASQLVTVHSQPTITLTSGTSCGSAAQITATGAATYSWAPATGLSCTNCSIANANPTSTTMYTVTGTDAYGCTNSNAISVNANRIYGHITFASTTPDTTDAKVWLIQYNPSDSSISALDSTATCNDGGTPYFEFASKPAGSYLVKAKLIYGNTPGTSGYIPTYSYSTAYWDTAAPVAHTSNADSARIHMLYGTVPAGSGFIGGSVVSGAGKGTAGEIAEVGLIVYLKDASGAILTYTYTDAAGQYSFSGLGDGIYYVYPADFSYYTTPSAAITLSASSPSATGIKFKKYTTSEVILPFITTGVDAVAGTNRQVTLFPNPTTGNVVISWGAAVTGAAVVTLTDVAGREVYQTKWVLNNDNHQTVQLSGVSNGVYLINIKGANLNYTGKVVIAE